MSLRSVLKQNKSNRYNGCFMVLRSAGSSYLSKQLGDEIGLNTGDFIDVLQDDARTLDYYLTRSNTGLLLSNYKDKNLYQFTARSLARYFGRQFGVDDKVIKIKVGPKTLLDGKEVYPLITLALK